MSNKQLEYPRTAIDDDHGTKVLLPSNILVEGSSTMMQICNQNDSRANCHLGICYCCY